MTTPSLFDLPPSSVPEPVYTTPPRFVASTSFKAYEAIKPTLQGRELFVIGELLAYEREMNTQPTAYELMKFAQQRWPDHSIDVNTVRPRLTALANEKHDRKDGRTYVKKTDKRVCSVTGMTAWTWRVL